MSAAAPRDWLSLYQLGLRASFLLLAQEPVCNPAVQTSRQPVRDSCSPRLGSNPRRLLRPLLASLQQSSNRRLLQVQFNASKQAWRIAAVTLHPMRLGSECTVGQAAGGMAAGLGSQPLSTARGRNNGREGGKQHLHKKNRMRSGPALVALPCAPSCCASPSALPPLCPRPSVCHRLLPRTQTHGDGRQNGNCQ